MLGAFSNWVAEDVTHVVTIVVVDVDALGLEEPTTEPLKSVRRLVLRFGGGSKEKLGIADGCCHA